MFVKLLNWLKSSTLVVIVLLTITTTSAQSNDFKYFWYTGGELFSPGAHLKSRDAIILGSLSAATLPAYFIDDDIRSYSQQAKTPIISSIAAIDDYYIPAFSASVIYLYAQGYATGNSENRILGRKLLESIFFSSIITQSIKTIVGRARPYTNEGADSFTPFGFSFAHNAFPSGHTSFIFSVATVLAENNASTEMQVALYSFATIGSLARIINDKHWLSDVLFGAAVGYFTGRIVSEYTPDKNSEQLNAPPPPAVSFTIMF